MICNNQKSLMRCCVTRQGLIQSCLRTQTTLSPTLPASPFLKTKPVRMHRVKNEERTSKHTHSYLQILGNGTDTGDTCPSVLLFFDAYRYVFNVGEGFQRYCFQHRLKLGKLCDIFLTRMSTEAAGGIPGLAITMTDQIKNNGAASQVSDSIFTLHGPLKLDKFMNAIRRFMNTPASTLSFSNFGNRDSAGEIGPILVSNEQVEIRPILILPDIKHRPFTLPWSGDNKMKRDVPVACYVCQLAKTPGKFLPEIAKSLGVRMGPDCGKLVAGYSVESENGQTIHPEQVMESATPGPTVFIIDCPDETYISSLTSSPGLKKHLKDGDEENRDLILIHLGPHEIISEERYMNWMRQFHDRAEHIIVNEEASQSQAIMRKAAVIQTKLNLVDEAFFPMPNLSCYTLDDDYLSGENVIRGKDLLKFNLKPLTHKGLDSSHLLDFFDKQSIADDFEKEEPEVMECIKRFHELRKEKRASEAKYGPNELEITFLGTGAAIPSKYRNVTGIYLDLFDLGSIMFDCGEGSYGQLIRRFGKEHARQAIRKLKCIWISHIHADHHIGLPTILTQRQKLMDSSDPPLIVIGPPSLYPSMEYYSELEPMSFQYIFNGECKDEPVLKQPRFLNKQRRSVATLQRLRESLGLKFLESFPVDHCPQAFGICLESQTGWKVVFSGDTRPCQSVIEAAKDATLLIHEATFEEEMKQEALEKNHSTTKDAIYIAQQANAYRTILTHFSQRYPKIPVINSDAENGVCIAFDLMTVNLSDLEMLPFTLEPCQGLFKKEQLDQEELNSTHGMTSD